ncbi:MAG TPA: Ldh family oxidoreductase [Burkholderiales bacterium]|jgi:LDH2 family malate/lactate/ureidoglycolate dehydrogenase
MKIAIDRACEIAAQSLEKLGLAPADARAAALHLIDCEVRGLGYAGLARILSIAERLRAQPAPPQPIRILRESPVSARLDGGDQLGYLVAERATEMAIAKAKVSGIGIVGANNTWYTGMLSYYAERVVAQDMVALLFSNASPWVAPEGGSEGRFGTNPVCAAFPSDEEPVIWDIGTSNIIHAQVVLAKRLGQPLPANAAFGPDGAPTTDPQAALAGALAPWGGHRGSGLALVVQMMGMLAGSPMMPGELRDFGYVAIVIRPDILTDTAQFKHEVAAYARTVRATRPRSADAPVRMPFDRSRAQRAEVLERGWIEVPDAALGALERL